MSTYILSYNLIEAFTANSVNQRIKTADLITCFVKITFKRYYQRLLAVKISSTLCFVDVNKVLLLFSGKDSRFVFWICGDWFYYAGSRKAYFTSAIRPSFMRKREFFSSLINLLLKEDTWTLTLWANILNCRIIVLFHKFFSWIIYEPNEVVRYVVLFN